MSLTRSLAATFALVFCNSASAAEFKKVDECAVGSKVSDRDNKSGTVTGISNGMCVVTYEDGKKRSYLHWMLRPAGTSQAVTDKLVKGVYPCYSSGNYLFMDVQIDGPDSYRDKNGNKGRYKLDAASGKITFESGPLQKANGKLMAGPAIGLNMSGGSFYNTTCGLKKK